MANTFDPVEEGGDGEEDEDDQEDSHDEKANGHNQFIMRKAKIRRIVNNMRLVMRKISIYAMAIYTVFISCSNRGVVVGWRGCNSLKEWIFPPQHTRSSSTYAIAVAILPQSCIMYTYVSVCLRFF